MTMARINRLMAWLAGLSSGILLLGLGLSTWLVQHRQQLPDPLLPEGSALLEHYNALAHQLWLMVMLLLIGVLVLAIQRLPAPAQASGQNKSLLHQTWTFIRRHPIACGLLTVYALLMVSESSWFYKEIVTWFDDIHNGLLLDNFGPRPSFIGEAMGRNDFRFFPLSHQDLHILSWFTPYPKVWALISAAELVATIGLSVAVVQQSLRLTKPQAAKAPALLLISCILYLFTSSAAYNYFQFIYSERLLSLLLALFTFHWLRSRETGDHRAALLALIWALLGSFLKDTAILWFAVPALASLLSRAPNQWNQHNQLERNLLCLVPFFLASATWLSLLPSLYLGDQRYDASLRFSTFELDIRTVVVLLFIVVRLTQWCRQRNDFSFSVIDGLNLGALAYALALWALVGFKSTSYMALPVNWVAVLDMLVVWAVAISPWLLNRSSRRITGAIGVGLSLSIVAVEHRFAHHFQERFSSIRNTQHSWRATFDAAQTLALEMKRRGEPVNLILSKSWFKHSDYLRSLPYDRLIYLDPDTHQAEIIDGIDRGDAYQAQPGDLLLDLDSGKKLKKYGIDLSAYRLIYDFDPAVSNGHIYRREAE
ncbi:hypothetical protein [Synechococcus sp. RS9916]|uniref:hypothetical protein n=1 Tax=Synechococcus sp. RS9916 TaxID=221359 RepID=UPI0000E537E1|nr:hypothetical protein [Synechococcus sp. RS9916]EAU75519.1 hypothetical protein RS9916_38467 [Synechococcus sp. RS9916]